MSPIRYSTTTLPFEQWDTVFPNAACAVALIDRLTHHAEIISIGGESRKREAAQTQKRKQDQNRRRAVARVSGIVSCPSIRSFGIARTTRSGARRGCAISTAIPRSIVTPSPSAALVRRAGRRVSRIRARSSTTRPRICSRPPQTIGLESWLTQIAWMRTLGREGGLFFTIGRKEASGERDARVACESRTKELRHLGASPLRLSLVGVTAEIL